LRSLATLALLVTVIGAELVWLDRSSRQASFDICERSTVDLVRAAGAGDVGAVEREIDPQTRDAHDNEGNTALGCAIPRGRTAAITALLAAGANPNEPSGVGPSQELPTELAFERNDTATLAALLDHGGDADRHTPSKTPLLTRAIQANNTVAVGLLLDHHANPDSQGKDVPLVVALRAGSSSAVDSLLDHGAHPDGKHGERPIVAAATANDGSSFDRLVAAGADLTAPATMTGPATVGEEALTQASGAGNLAIVNDLLGRGTNANHDSYLSPLLRSVTFKHGDVTRRLLDAGADPDLGEADALSLTWTLSSLNPALADRIAEPTRTATAVPDPGNSGGTGTGLDLASLPRIQVPPLAAALAAGDNDAVDLLLAHGADPNRVTADHFSPLYLTAATCNLRATHLLLDHGARPELAPAGYDPTTISCPAVGELLTR